MGWTYSKGSDTQVEEVKEYLGSQRQLRSSSKSFVDQRQATCLVTGPVCECRSHGKSEHSAHTVMYPIS